MGFGQILFQYFLSFYFSFSLSTNGAMFVDQRCHCVACFDIDKIFATDKVFALIGTGSRTENHCFIRRRKFFASQLRIKKVHRARTQVPHQGALRKK